MVRFEDTALDAFVKFKECLNTTGGVRLVEDIIKSIDALVVEDQHTYTLNIYEAVGEIATQYRLSHTDDKSSQAASMSFIVLYYYRFYKKTIKALVAMLKTNLKPAGITVRASGLKSTLFVNKSTVDPDLGYHGKLVFKW